MCVCVYQNLEFYLAKVHSAVYTKEGQKKNNVHIFPGLVLKCVLNKKHKWLCVVDESMWLINGKKCMLYTMLQSF